MSNEEPSESKELMKVEKLGPNSREVNTVVKVVSKSEVRNVTGRDYSVHRVADASVGDETGCVVLTLWDDNIDKINEEATLRVTNGYVNPVQRKHAPKHRKIRQLRNPRRNSHNRSQHRKQSVRKTIRTRKTRPALPTTQIRRKKRLPTKKKILNAYKESQSTLRIYFDSF